MNAAASVVKNIVGRTMNRAIVSIKPVNSNAVINAVIRAASSETMKTVVVNTTKKNIGGPDRAMFAKMKA